MAGLLNTGTNKITLAPQYKDPRAAILTGAGNKSISDDTIRAYIKQPGMTNDKVFDAMMGYGVSESQLSKATGWTPQQIRDYTKTRGVSYDQDVTEFEIPEAKPTKANYQPAAFVPAVQDPVKGTVAGQLNTVLDPNSPLMKRAATFANQQMNRRGLLNSGGAISAAQAAMTDAGLQIATPDANSNNQFSLYNAGEQNQNNRFNSQLGAQLDMFNAGNATDVSKFNAGNATNLIQSREQNATSILNNNNTLANNLAIANLDVDTKRMIAGIQARSEDSRYAASLYDTLLKLQSDIQKNPDIPADDKSRMFGELVGTFNASMGLFDTIQSAGLSEQLQNFKTSNRISSQTSNLIQSSGQQSRRGIIYNRNNQPVDLVSVNTLKGLNDRYGTNYKPEQLLSKQEIDALGINNGSSVNSLGPTWRKTLQDRGIVEYMAKDKLGLDSPTGLWMYV